LKKNDLLDEGIPHGAPWSNDFHNWMDYMSPLTLNQVMSRLRSGLFCSIEGEN